MVELELFQLTHLRRIIHITKRVYKFELLVNGACKRREQLLVLLCFQVRGVAKQFLLLDVAHAREANTYVQIIFPFIVLEMMLECCLLHSKHFMTTTYKK